jgi:hypothetical protein
VDNLGGEVRVGPEAETFLHPIQASRPRHYKVGSPDNLMAKGGICYASTCLALRCVCSRPNPA